MTKQLLQNTLGWGFALWLIGYLLGFIFFFILPPALLGWVIMPIGTAITLWVLIKQTKINSLQSALHLSISWTAIAIIFDYLFIVQLLKPVDGYYKPDVFVYYLLTFALPLLAAWWLQKRSK